MLQHIDKSYGFPITDVSTINSQVNVGGLVPISFWVAFARGSQFSTLQNIIGNPTGTNLNIAKTAANQIVVRNGTTVVHTFTFTVEPLVPIHIVNVCRVGSTSPRMIWVNGEIYPYPADSVGMDCRIIGSSGCSFSLFSIVGKNLDGIFGVSTFSVQECMRLYNNGFGISLHPMITTLGYSDGINYVIPDLLPSTGNLIIKGTPFYANRIATSRTNARYIGLVNTQSTVAVQAINSPDSFPKRNGKIVYYPSVGLPQGETISDYLDNRNPYVVVTSKTGDLEASGTPALPDKIDFIALRFCTFINSAQVISSYKGTYLEIANCIGLNSLTISAIRDTLTLLLTNNSNSFHTLEFSGNAGIEILEPTITSNRLHTLTLDSSSRFRGTFTFSNTFQHCRVTGLANSNTLAGIEASTGTFGFDTFNGSDPSGFPLDLSGCSSLTTINIRNSPKLGSIILPSTARPLSLTITGADLVESRITNLLTHAAQYTQFRIANAALIDVFPSGLDCSTFVNCTVIITTVTGAFIAPTNNVLQSFSLDNCSVTSINRIPTSVTQLLIRNVTTLVQSIDLSGHAVNIAGGVEFTNSTGITGITLPPTNRTMGALNCSGCTSFVVPTFSGVTWVILPSGLNTVFNIFNCVQTGISEITGLPLGTWIRSRTINLSQAIPANKMSVEALLKCITNIYDNFSNFETVAKSLSVAHTDISGSDRTLAIISGSGYVQATTGVNGVDGVYSAAYNAETTINKIRHVLFVLVNQNNNSTTVRKYNWTVIN